MEIAIVKVSSGVQFEARGTQTFIMGITAPVLEVDSCHIARRRIMGELKCVGSD